MITIEQFKEVQIQVGLVLEAVDQEGSEKLIRLTVNLGEEQPRTIFTGVRPYGFEAEYFGGKKFLFVTNLESKKMMGMESQGMILAVDGEGGKPIFVQAIEEMAIGARVR